MYFLFIYLSSILSLHLPQELVTSWGSYESLCLCTYDNPDSVNILSPSHIEPLHIMGIQSIWRTKQKK